jgi:hypothetical protein
MTARYDILRFRFKGETTVVKTGVTLEEAQEHCQREDTHGEGWFDGYREIKLNYFGNRYPRNVGLLERSVEVFCEMRKGRMG